MTDSQATPKKLPPFARAINPDDSLVMIYCGEKAWRLAQGGPVSWVEYLAGWDKTKERVASLVFPKNRDPGEFSWPVKGKQVLVLACDEPDDAVDLLAVELLRAGADLVHVRYSDERLAHYDPTAPRRRAP